MDHPGVQGSSMSQEASVQPDTGPLKAMGEFFVAVEKSESSSDGGGTNLPSPDGGSSGPVQPNNSGFQPIITALKRVFEIATNHRQVCMAVQRDLISVFCVLLWKGYGIHKLCFLLIFSGQAPCVP